MSKGQYILESVIGWWIFEVYIGGNRLYLQEQNSSVIKHILMCIETIFHISLHIL